MFLRLSPAILKEGEVVLAGKEAKEHRAKKGKGKMTKVNAMSGAQNNTWRKIKRRLKKKLRKFVPVKVRAVDTFTNTTTQRQNITQWKNILHRLKME